MSWHNRNVYIVDNVPPIPEKPFSSKTPDLMALEKSIVAMMDGCPRTKQNQQHVKEKIIQHVVIVPSDRKDSYFARFTVMEGCNSAIDDKASYGYTWPVLGLTGQTTATTSSPQSVFFVGRPGLRSLCGTPRSIDYWNNNKKRSLRLANPELDKDPVYFDPMQSRNFYTSICPSNDVCNAFHAPLVRLGPRLWSAMCTMDADMIPELSELCEQLRYNVSGRDNDDTIYDAETLLAAASPIVQSTERESHRSRSYYRV